MSLDVRSIAGGVGLLAISVLCFKAGGWVTQSLRQPAPQPVALRPAPAPKPAPKPIVTVVPAEGREAAPVAERVLPAAPERASEAAGQRRSEARDAARGHWRDQPGAAPPTEAHPAQRSEPPPPRVEPASAMPVRPAAPPPVQPRPEAAARIAPLDRVPALAAAIASLGSGPKAVQLLAAAARVEREPDDGEAWGELARHLHAARRAEAEPTAERALSLAKAQRDRAAMASATALLGQIALERGEVLKGLELSEQAIVLDLDHGRLAEAAYGLARIGSYHERAGNAGEAEARYTAALDAAVKGYDTPHAIRIMQRLGDIARGRRELDRAAELYQGALGLSHRSGNAEAMADQYANLGRVFAEKGERGEAETYWRSARDQYVRLGLQAKTAEMAGLLGAGAGVSPAAAKPRKQGTR
jgi:tetratricopeptide (TPR) repeat protein